MHYCNEEHLTDHRFAHSHVCSQYSIVVQQVHDIAIEPHPHLDDIAQKLQRAILALRFFRPSTWAAVLAMVALIEQGLQHPATDWFNFTISRDLYAGALLQLGHDQRAYDVAKWWLVQNVVRVDADRVLESCQFLTLANEDAFEDCAWLPLIDPQRRKYVRDCTQAHLVVLVLLKIKLLLDLQRVVPRSTLVIRVRARLQGDDNAVRATVDALKGQVKTLVLEVTRANRWLWAALLEPETFFAPMSLNYRREVLVGQSEESWKYLEPGSMPLQYLIREWDSGAMKEIERMLSHEAWAQTPGALAYLQRLEEGCCLGMKKCCVETGRVCYVVEETQKIRHFAAARAGTPDLTIVDF